MKKILIVNTELQDIEKSKKIIFKKNKTIIKDLNYFNEDYLNELKAGNIEYKFMIEEWEILNENKIQIIMSNNGTPLKPVHICSDFRPKDGIKALFQSEKMIILKIQSNNTFELSKVYINDLTDYSVNVLKFGLYENLEDIKKEIPETFHPALDNLIKVYDVYLNQKYVEPIWGKTI